MTIPAPAALLFLFVFPGLIACSQPEHKPDLRAQLESLDKQLLDSAGHIRRTVAGQYIQTASQWIETARDTARAAKYGFQAADVARNTGDFDKAIAIYDRLEQRFGAHRDIGAKALFAKAFVLDNNLKQIDRARQAYQAVLDKYPDAAIARQVPAALQALGKSEEELLKMLKEKSRASLKDAHH